MKKYLIIKIKKIIILVVDIFFCYKILWRFSRVIVMRYDNDCNDDMYKNGETNLIKFLASTNLFSKRSNSIQFKQKEYFFDVGANLGKYSEILQHYFIDKANRQREREIVAFDPSLDNINKIKKINLKNIRLVNCAVSSKNGSKPFFESKDRLHSGTDSLFDMNSIGYYSKNFKKK